LLLNFSQQAIKKRLLEDPFTKPTCSPHTTLGHMISFQKLLFLPLISYQFWNHLHIKLRVTVYSTVLDAEDHEYAFEANSVLSEHLSKQAFAPAQQLKGLLITPIFFGQLYGLWLHY